MRSAAFRATIRAAALWGGGAEATIMGRNEVVEECIIEGNRVGSPPAALAGGPTNHRLIWLSTGHGSVTHNWIARNGVTRLPGRELRWAQARLASAASPARTRTWAR